MLPTIAFALGASLSPSPVSASSEVAPAKGVAPNILVVVADDLGVDQLALYGEGEDYPLTPTIDGLAASGVFFRNAYSNSHCTPTRATLQTGRYGFRTGMGTGVSEEGPALQLSEFCLPEVLDAGAPLAYAHGAFGKWHLGNAEVGGVLAPNRAGWAHYQGALGNFTNPSTYNSWTEITNGTPKAMSTYATTAEVNAVRDWVASVPEPWFAMLNFHAPHAPWKTPPAGLYSVDLTSADPPESDPRPYYKAMVEALDTELGRLLTEIGDALDNTVVIFLGDNGTPAQVVVPGTPAGQHKGPITEGGTNVPFIVSGPQVLAPGSESAAFVNTTDLFATVAELAGVDLAATLPAEHALDSISLVPYLTNPARPSLRSTVYTEGFEPNGPNPSTVRRGMRGERYKLVRFDEWEEFFYDLEVDPHEQTNLLEGELTVGEQEAYGGLVAAHFELLGYSPALATVYGSSVNPAGSMAILAGAPVVAGQVQLGVDNPLGTQAAGSLPILLVSLAPDLNYPAGSLLPDTGMGGPGADGELLLDVTAFASILVGAPWSALGVPVEIGLSIPPIHNLIGTVIYAQAVFVDESGTSGVPFGLTQGAELRIGPSVSASAP